MSFEHLGLKPELLRAVAEKGYTTPSPIQAQAIPAVLSGRDLIAGAQTGTGKTAAFVLPTLQRLTQSPHTGRTPRALVLTPTRELAAQVTESARNYGKYVNVRTAVVFGGVSVNPQIDAMRSGCDVLIATPGRLLDLAEQRAVDLRDVQIFVLDEADRMLDMGFIHAIRRVLKLLPAQRQNLMFSATYSEEIRELANRFLRNPATVEVAPRNATADRVEQTAYRVSKEHKRHLLAHLIDSGNWHQVLVFTRTKHGANRLAQQLEGSGIRSAAIHGNKSQGARVRALADFKDNRITALVATEVAARGLDIKELPHVVNYELPNVPEDYVHRIGRTARAGTTGSAVSLVSPDEAPLLRDIERLLRRSLPIAPLPEFPVTAPPPAAAHANGSDRPSRHGGERRHSDRNRQSGERHSGDAHDAQRRNARGNDHSGEGHNSRRQGRDSRQGGGHDSRRDHGPSQRQGHGSHRDPSSRRAPEPNGNVAPPLDHRAGGHRGQGHDSPQHRGADQRQGQRHGHEHRGGNRDHGGADQRGGNRSHGHGRPGGFGNGNSQGRSRPQRQRRTGSY